MASSSSSIKSQLLDESGKAFKGVVPSSVTTSSPLARNKLSSDVFINHRGPDAKRTLAEDVYNALSDKGLEVFLDNKKLDAGDLITIEMEEAMKRARLHIAIISQGYADSPWCLAELSFMLETKTKIIPIFYLVSPNELRWVSKGKGIYASAFRQHEENNRYSPEKLQEWKWALERVSNISGYIVDNYDAWKGELEKLKKRVAKEIKRPLLVSRDRLFGLEETAEDFENKTIRSASYDSSAQIVGIVGMGGCGKTTLAKQVYNVYNRKFTPIQSSFLYNVRESKNELPKLQKKLLKNLNAEVGDSSFENEKEGMDFIADSLRSVRMLVVVDDVDHKDQIDALVPPEHILGSGSLIIITTRDFNVLKSAGISSSSIYKMKGLDPVYARGLFCSHAFKSCDTPQEFEDLIEKSVNTSQGLPLSLKVFGKQLCGQPREYWECQLHLHDFSSVLPEDIISTLKKSYDALNPEEKELFLDIACFFIGERKSLVIEVWDGMGHSGMYSLDKLIDKCLVELDEKNRIRMHDHLRDLGRKIAREKSPYRIWHERQINKSSQQAREKMEIRGIMAATTSFLDIEETCSSHYDPFEDGFCSQYWPLEECVDVMKSSSPHLELLVLKGKFFNRKICQLPKGLVWLRWFDFDHALLPSYLTLRNLRVLELYQIQSIKTLWENNMDPPLQLRELVIQEQLSRDHNGSFQSFPKSIRSLKHFKKLVIHGRKVSESSFSSLPKSIGRLEHLKKLVIHCRKESSLSSLPDEFCDLQSLEHLELEGLEMLSSLPNRFGNLRNLRLVTLKKLSNRGLSSLLTAFGDLPCLEKLYISSCNNSISLPISFGNLSHLTILHIHDCSSLECLPDSFGNFYSLTTLHIHGCSNLECLPTSFGNLSSLTTLHIGHCQRLRSFPNSLGRLSLLKELKMVSLGVNSIPEAFRQLANLQKVSIEM